MTKTGRTHLVKAIATREAKGLAAGALAFVALLAPGLQPPAFAVNVICTRYVNAVWSNPGGRIVLNSSSAQGAPTFRVWNICDSDRIGPRITPGVCQTFYTSFLVGLTSGLPVTLVFDSAILDQNGLWTGGTCDSISNWSDVEPAISGLQVGR